MNAFNIFIKRLFRNKLRLQEQRVQRLETEVSILRSELHEAEVELLEAKLKLHEAQEAFTRAYITKFWRGKTLEMQIEERRRSRERC